MKTSFMTLGCPAWDLDTLCRQGQALGFAGVDLRGYLDTLDITLRPEFTTHAAATRRQLADAGLEVSAISSSLQVCRADKQAENLEEARRTIAAAHALGCQNVRLFGGGDLAGSSHAALAQVGAETVARVLALDGARDLRWLFETHDLWVQAANCRLLLERIPDAAFGALWDMGHTYRVGGEPPEATFEALLGRVGYTHVKDARYVPGQPGAMEDGWRYVLPGAGELPLARSIQLLRESGYAGWLTFEHEKRWHPDLPEPEVAFPAFRQWVEGLNEQRPAIGAGTQPALFHY